MKDVSGSAVLAKVLSALTIATLQVSMAISFAALLFAGSLSDGTPRAAAGFIVGTAIVVAWVGVSTRTEVAIGGAQDTGVVVAIAVLGAIAVDTAEDERLPTVYAAIAVVTIVTGIVFFIVGRQRLAAMARSIPFTVVSGFVAGTGWLLVRGGFEVMVGRALEWGDLRDLFVWSEMQRWLPGVALALGLTIMLRRGAPPLIVGIALAGTATAIHVLARTFATGAWLDDHNWLLGPFSAAEGWAPIGPDILRAADWSAIGAQSVGLAAIVVVSLIGLLLNLTGLESATNTDIDLDHELEVAGWSNAAAAFGGGIVGYHLIGDTTIARQMGARGRGVPLMVSALCFVAVIVGTESVGQVPRAIAGGVLAMSGLNLFADWVRQVRADLNRLDAILSGGVLVVIVALGVLSGIAAGVLAAAIVFVVSYSRVSPIVAIRRLGEIESNVDRPDVASRHLEEHAAEVAVIELDGYLFFGSLSSVSAAVDLLLADSNVRVLIIDLSRVQGLDASVLEGFASLARRARDAHVRIVWCGMAPRISERLSSNSVDWQESDLDHALEHAEDLLLEEIGEVNDGSGDREFADWIEAIRPHGVVRQLVAGESLIEPGEMSTAMYVVETGELTAWQGGRLGHRRLRRVGRGSILGELAYYTGVARTAEVIADTDAVVIELDEDSLGALESSDLELALQTEKRFATRLANRVAKTSANLRDDR
ncbi:MAG: SulP family inorganic anion transporter [Acidimicrobiales bacterium]